MRGKNYVRDTATYGVILLISVLFVLLFSYSTSVFYPDYYECDQSEFLTMGKMWANGRLPYIEQFDHKGPIIFFVNMVGMQLMGTKAGVSIVQMCFMFFTLLSFYRICIKDNTNRLLSILLTVVFLVTLKLNFCRGNTVEEYCLPFIGFSTYGLLKWFKDKQKEHNWKWAFFYGITFGACLFTRATNIAPITGYILIICIFLLVNRSYLNLLKNALAFISGTALVLIPFIIYFAAHGALYDLIYATFIHNIKYFNGAEPWLITYGTGILGQFFETYFAYYCILFLIIIKIYQKDYWLAAAFGVIAIVETYVFMGGFIVTHYPLVCIFQIGILMLEVVQLIKDNTKASKSLGIVILLFLCVHIGYNCIYKDILEISDYRENYSEITERPYERLVKEIPTDELDDFVVFGRDGIAEAYLVTDTLPCNRFGFIQDWYASFSEKIEADIRKEYAENGPTWILSDQGTIIIDDILEKDYYVYDLEDVYVLWKKYEK